MKLFISKSRDLDAREATILALLNGLCSNKQEYLTVSVNGLAYNLTRKFLNKSVKKDRVMIDNIKSGILSLADRKIITILDQNGNDYIISNDGLEVNTEKEKFVVVELWELQKVFAESNKPFNVFDFFLNLVGTINGITKEWHMSQDDMTSLWGYGTLLFIKECTIMKKRADGRYCKQILVGYHPDGKRKMKTIYGKTIKEVEKKERECRLLIEQGIHEENNITVREWSEMWLKTYKATVAYNTYQMYSNSLQKHINPILGDIPLKNIKTIQIQQILNKLIDGGNSRTAEIVRLTIKQFMKQALVEGYIYKDVVGAVKSVKNQSEEKRALTDIEHKAIQDADLTPKQRIFLNIMLYTGLRRGEVLALTVDDINISKKTISVNKSLYHKVNDADIKEPKSKAGYRQVPIPDTLINELKAYISSLNNDILFPMNNGNYMTKSSFRKFWDGIMASVKQAASDTEEISFTPHIFRHTYATNLYYADVDIKTAQYFLGHSSLSMTLGIYTHLDKLHMKDEIDKLNEYLVSQKSVKS